LARSGRQQAGGPSARYGDRQGEARARFRSLRCLLDPGAAAVALGDVLHQRQADAAAPDGPLLAAGARARPANEALEDALPLLLRHAGPVIDDAHDQHGLPRQPGDPPPALAADAHADDLRAGGVLERVVDEVDHGELDGAVIDVRARQAGLDLGRELHALAL